MCQVGCCDVQRCTMLKFRTCAVYIWLKRRLVSDQTACKERSCYTWKTSQNLNRRTRRSRRSNKIITIIICHFFQSSIITSFSIERLHSQRHPSFVFLECFGNLGYVKNWLLQRDVCVCLEVHSLSLLCFLCCTDVKEDLWIDCWGWKGYRWDSPHSLGFKRALVVLSMMSCKDR